MSVTKADVESCGPAPAANRRLLRGLCGGVGPVALSLAFCLGQVAWSEDFEFDHALGWQVQAGTLAAKDGCLVLYPSKGRAQAEVNCYVDVDKKPFLELSVLKGKFDILLARTYPKRDTAMALVAEGLTRGEHAADLRRFGLAGRTNLALRLVASKKTVLDYIRFLEKPGLVVKKPANTIPPLAEYVVRRTAEAITIDGLGSEPAWQKAPSTGAFWVYHGQEPASLKTEAKLLWDDKNLYLLVTCEDPDIRAKRTVKDDNLWAEDCIEFFIMEQKFKERFNHFVEYEVNPIGTIMDAYNIAPYRGIVNWDSRGWKSAVKVEGTINNPADKDKGWTVEMSIPFMDAYAEAWVSEERAKAEAWDYKPFTPKPGDAWRVNIYRIKYGDTFCELIAWSPTVTGGFHQIERFGKLVFSDKLTGAE